MLQSINVWGETAIRENSPNQQEEVAVCSRGVFVRVPIMATIIDITTRCGTRKHAMHMSQHSHARTAVCGAWYMASPSSACSADDDVEYGM